ncbi:hypothetical protein [Bacillus sp. SH5-2]|uniref:hypothetical protein n=1 Tax=Bacillus sp. SH5-2 TaxID=2217834 RepID=UPI0015D400F8|nr:hypothetical protein [Bacillus sp. SH5-2]
MEKWPENRIAAYKRCVEAELRDIISFENDIKHHEERIKSLNKTILICSQSANRMSAQLYEQGWKHENDEYWVPVEIIKAASKS